jgi:hypothetical protein
MQHLNSVELPAFHPFQVSFFSFLFFFFFYLKQEFKFRRYLRIPDGRWSSSNCFLSTPLNRSKCLPGKRFACQMP